LFVFRKRVVLVPDREDTVRFRVESKTDSLFGAIVFDDGVTTYTVCVEIIDEVIFCVVGDEIGSLNNTAIVGDIDTGEVLDKTVDYFFAYACAECILVNSVELTRHTVGKNHVLLVKRVA